MSTVSFEVLTLTFKHLESKDLAQCQQVSKSWNQSSLKLLYSEITIDTEDKAFKYVRTINGSSRLGKYLEIINIGTLFEKQELYDTWDRYHLLHAVIKHCPNLLKINCKNPHSPFWTKLALAATQGGLPRLQYVTCPEKEDFDSYLYTVLAFKQTITEIELPDLDNELPDLLESEAYPILRENLNQFPCLETLKIYFRSGHKMTYYDGLINSCKNLKKLTISPATEDDEFPEEDIIIDDQSFQPCENIHTLRCGWVTLTSDNQMNYIMQKFPNLKSFFVTCPGYPWENYNPDSVDNLTKFLDFTTNIQECQVNMVTDEEKAVDIWGSIINEKYKNMNVIIFMSTPFQFDGPVTVASVKRSEITLQFQPSRLTESRYNKFLKMARENVRTLSLGLAMFCKNNPYGIFDNMEKIVRAVQLCPSLEELTLKHLDDIPFLENMTYQHSGVTSLLVQECNHWTSVGTLENMSFVFPNLKKVYIYDNTTSFGQSSEMDIFMPNSSLDSLRWQFNAFTKDNILAETYIRLEINSVISFHIAFEDKLSSITEKQFDHPRPDQVYLEITCRKLNKLIINHSVYTF